MRIRRTSLVPRQQYVRDVKIFVVATEDEKAEGQYLDIFRTKVTPRVHVEVLPTGPDGLSAARHVLDRLATFEAEYSLALAREDELWLMMDVDRQPRKVLEEVTQMAAESGYKLAVSAPCFELWILLHFRDHDMADTTCRQVVSRLQRHLGGYNKARIDPSLFTRDAIERAVEAAKVLDRPENVRVPAYPGTHIYKLVEKLLTYWPDASRSPT